jgi:protein-S-isoprenylcysteine O-methyltransferase Ste14
VGMTTTVLAYLLIACYFVMERLLRKGKQALNLQPGASDRSSSRIIWICGLLSIVLVLLAPILNIDQLGNLSNAYLAWAGLLLMFSGLSLRYWSAKVLGEFYTRTLLTVEGQTIIEKAPYSIIRHPGYLGTFMMEVGAGLAVMNWIILSVVAIMGIVSRTYRIKTEEEMLEKSFREQYKVYSIKTWKLFPFIY